MNFEDIISDTTHGSTYIAKSYLQLLQNHSYDKSQIQNMNKKLRKVFPDMAIITSITNKLDQTERIDQKVQILIRKIARTIMKIQKHLETRIEVNDTLMTFSNSQTIIDVIKNMESSKLTIYSMESLPGGEGEVLAEKIGSTVISDQQGYEMIAKKVDAVLIGCDRFDEKYIVNKVGTRDLCHHASKTNVPVYVLTSSLKEVDSVGKVKDKIFEKILRDMVCILSND